MSFTEPTPKGSFDLFGPVHKGLRMAHANLMIRLGAVELEDDRALSGLLQHLREHLRLCQDYQGYEETVIHAALAPHAPGAVQDLDDAHQSVRAILEEIEIAARSLETAPPAGRRRAARALYLAYSRFVAANLAHMAEDEEETLPLLQALFDDEALLAMKTRIVAGLTPFLGAAMLRMMVPAVRHEERLRMLRAIRDSAAPAVFADLMDDVVRPSLAQREWRRLNAELAPAAKAA
jgi:hypothetical protein